MISTYFHVSPLWNVHADFIGMIQRYGSGLDGIITTWHYFAFHIIGNNLSRVQ